MSIHHNRKNGTLMSIILHTEVPVTSLPAQTELMAGRERDEFQQKIDKDVASLKIKTARAGWPAPDPEKLFQHYVVGSNDKAALNAVIRRAGTLHKVEIRFYKAVKTEAGHLVVKFHVTRKVGEDGKPVKDDTLNADGTPKDLAQPKPVAK
jgi:hypothetical protein